MPSEASSAPRFGNFVGGEWHTPAAAATFADENPAVRRSVLAHFHASTAADVTAAVDQAALAFRGWRRTRVAERQQLHEGARRRIVFQCDGEAVGAADGHPHLAWLLRCGGALN